MLFLSTRKTYQKRITKSRTCLISIARCCAVSCFFPLLGADKFFQATLVAAWIGPPTETTDLAIEIIGNRFVLSDQSEAVFNCGKHTKKGVVEEFCARDYWKRVWVVQEFLLARDIIIMCGNQELDRMSFEYMKKVSFAKAFELVEMKLKPGRFDDHTGFPCGNHTLSDLLTLCFQRDCTDFRDRIYGLQGLLREHERVQVDYALSKLDLYRQVLAILKTSHAATFKKYPAKSLEWDRNLVRMALELTPTEHAELDREIELIQFGSISVLI
jgi:hypothetical protein